jgi:hypothetical protein
MAWPTCCQVLVVDARADVHVQADQLQPMLADRRQRSRQVGMPDAVLAVLAAGVGLVAVAVAEAGVDAQPDGMAGRGAPSWCSMSIEPALTSNAVLGDGGQRGVVQQVGGEDDLVAAGFIARGQRPQDLATRHRIDLARPLAAAASGCGCWSRPSARSARRRTLQRARRVRGWWRRRRPRAACRVRRRGRRRAGFRAECRLVMACMVPRARHSDQITCLSAIHSFLIC